MHNVRGIGSILLAVVWLLQGYELIEYHPYDARIEGETGLTEKNIRLIEERCRESVSSVLP